MEPRTIHRRCDRVQPATSGARSASDCHTLWSIQVPNLHKMELFSMVYANGDSDIWALGSAD
jgi:hypothetical protein